MKPGCQREEQTSAAVRGGEKKISPEIAAHAQHCPACSEILLVSEFLQNNALADHELSALPDPRLIWQEARRRANQEATRLALRPIRFMQIIAVVAFASSPWLRWLLPMGREFAASWFRAPDFNLVFVSRVWLPAANQAIFLLGFAVATILLSLSSWYMMRQE